MLPARPFFMETFMEAVLAIAPKETKKNFLRRIWEYEEICAELKAQHDDPIGAKKVLFGKHSALAERRMIEFREAFGKPTIRKRPPLKASNTRTPNKPKSNI